MSSPAIAEDAEPQPQPDGRRRRRRAPAGRRAEETALLSIRDHQFAAAARDGSCGSGEDSRACGVTTGYDSYWRPSVFLARSVLTQGPTILGASLHSVFVLCVRIAVVGTAVGAAPQRTAVAA
jgi:hypothetical protein